MFAALFLLLHLFELIYHLFEKKMDTLFKKVKDAEVTKMIANHGSTLFAAINVAWSGYHLLHAERMSQLK